MYEEAEIPKETMRREIEECVVTLEKFTRSEIDKELKIFSRRGKKYRSGILAELVEKNILARDGDRYRVLQLADQEIDWQNANVDDTLDIKWPLRLHDWIRLYPKSVAVVAGSPGAGKTAFLYNFILLNLERDDIILWTNDMEAEEMQERFIAFQTPLPVPAPWKTYRRYADFGDAIKKYPDAIHIIDYLSMQENFWAAGTELAKIDEALGRGMALVAIQKKPQQKLGVGGVHTAMKPKLYLSMETIAVNGSKMGQLTIEKSRSKASPTLEPNGVRWTYNIDNGARFTNVQRQDRGHE